MFIMFSNYGRIVICKDSAVVCIEGKTSCIRFRIIDKINLILIFYGSIVTGTAGEIPSIA